MKSSKNNAKIDTPGPYKPHKQMDIKKEEKVAVLHSCTFFSTVYFYRCKRGSKLCRSEEHYSMLSTCTGGGGED